MLEKSPPREKIENPESKRIRKLIELFEIGLDDEEGSIGYHGTSLESIEFLIKTGHLPGGTGENPTSTQVQKGDLYFYPLRSKFKKHPLAETFPDESEIIERTAGYAEDIAREHYFLTKLGFELNNKKYGYIARILTGEGERFFGEYDTLYKELIAMGIKKETLDETIKEARKRKGVVIALSKKLLERFTPTDGDKDSGDLKIHFSDGLDYNDISGLEPIGQEEWDYFERLQQEKCI